ncbi:MAG: ribose 5-phosphate isomerase B [Magnetococcales bacterium]|nr:ribose 5-phosphate isomerase B [Magnetococcales bacterium]
MRILTACDHGAYELKELLRHHLESRNHAVVNLGTDGPESVDYPDYAAKLCRALLAGEGERGILLCGTGIGISIAANRFPGIRAALCHDELTARLAREHNDANVLVLGGRTTGAATALGILDVWLDTPFAGGRHQRRLDRLEQVTVRG